MEVIQKCLLILLTNMLYLLLDNKVLITIMLLILKALQRKFGNSVEEFYMKENTNQLMPNKIKNSQMLI